MDLFAQITAYLLDHPASRAREIASGLSADKSDVNRILYAGRDRYFVVNAEYQWNTLNNTSHAPLSTTCAVATVPDAASNTCDDTKQTRTVLARLKRGVPPDQNAAYLAVGMNDLQDRLGRLLDDKPSARWFGITGEYGDGKTFFRTMANRQSLDAGYAVASFDVNRDDGALHQPQRHSSVLLDTLRSPLVFLRSHQGIIDLFRQWSVVTPRHDLIMVLERLQHIPAPITNVHDTGEVAWQVQQAIEMARVPSADIANSRPLLRLATLFSCVDIVGRSSQARFSAAYRLQLVVEWLSLIGHKGLLLFVDELDNVVRQIHGKAHPACFRTLAWYCSAPQLKALRVIVAMTPEMEERVSATWRTMYGDSLELQQTVRAEECVAYNRWKREAALVSADGWENCPTLDAADRLELFRRIASLHAIAWGTSWGAIDDHMESLAKLPAFRNTRRWVRACVSILDLLQQYPELQNNGSFPSHTYA
jgi:hypothetical protein